MWFIKSYIVQTPHHGHTSQLAQAWSKIRPWAINLSGSSKGCGRIFKSILLKNMPTSHTVSQTLFMYACVVTHKICVRTDMQWYNWTYIHKFKLMQVLDYQILYTDKKQKTILKHPNLWRDMKGPSGTTPGTTPNLPAITTHKQSCCVPALKPMTTSQLWSPTTATTHRFLHGLSRWCQPLTRLALNLLICLLSPLGLLKLF